MMPMALDLGEVTIVSDSMSHTIHPLTVQRFSSSLSRKRVPCSSVRALHRQKTLSAAGRAARRENNCDEDGQQARPLPVPVRLDARVQ